MLCPRCQRTVDPGAAFCGNCGVALTPATSLAEAQAPYQMQSQSQTQTQTPMAPPTQPLPPPQPAAQWATNQTIVPQAAPAAQVVLQPQLAQAAAPQVAQPVYPIAAPPATLVPPAWPATGSIPGPAPGYPAYPAPVAVNDHSGLAIASFVLGVIGLPAVLIPIVGIVFGVLAIVFGTLSVRSARRVLAIIGMSLAVLVLLVSIFLWVHNTQALLQQRRTGLTPSSSTASGPLQPISTPCYTTKLPAAMKITQTAGSCTFQAVDTATGEQYAVKVLTVPQLTLSNLSTAAKNDAANVVNAIPGGSIGSQMSATFAESQAYEIHITSTDGSAGTISYVYDTTSQGNLVIVLHTQPHVVNNNDSLSAIATNWSWL